MQTLHIISRSEEGGGVTKGPSLESQDRQANLSLHKAFQHSHVKQRITLPPDAILIRKTGDLWMLVHGYSQFRLSVKIKLQPINKHHFWENSQNLIDDSCCTEGRSQILGVYNRVH